MFERSPRSLHGLTEPRVAPPIPAKSLVREYDAAARELGIRLMPWQRLAARYLTGRVRRRWAFREVVVVVARQNGKTELLIPLILQRLRAGEKILHTAQNRDLPRQTFLRIARLVAGLPEIDSIRKANGQEEILTVNGGRYKLVAPNSNVRGESADTVLLDEVREQEDQDVMDAILPTITARPNPQVIYLSNAGSETSLILNDLRRRKDGDKRLAYLEWSAAPGRTLDDREGWAEANPGLGITINIETMEYNLANRPPASFETEHLCRWVISTQPRLVDDLAWQRCRDQVGIPLRPAFAINMDPSGTRVSAVIAWPQSNGTVACQVVLDEIGEPIDTDVLGPALRQAAMKLGALNVSYDPWTDADLARHFRDPKPLTGREWANASENFVRVVDSGRLRWQDATQITSDLAWTARKPHESGAWQAVKAKEDRPITAALAAIRAVWLASGPKPSAPKVM